MAQDPSLESAADTLGSMAGLASMALPAPAGTVAGMGFTIFGSLFGSDQEASDAAKLEEIVTNLRGINSRLDSIDQSLGTMQSSLEDIQQSLRRVEHTLQDILAGVRYNSESNDRIYHNMVQNGFLEIHASYRNLMELHVPSNNWEEFFRDAHTLRQDLLSTRGTQFSVDEIKSYLEWYETASVNEEGMCGQARMFNFITSIRTELYLIDSFYCFTKSEPCAAGNYCWGITEPSKQVLFGALTEQYKEDMEGYQELLYPVARGGLGIAHLIGRPLSELSRGIQHVDGVTLGFCFRCNNNRSINWQYMPQIADGGRHDTRLLYPTTCSVVGVDYPYKSYTTCEEYLECDGAFGSPYGSDCRYERVDWNCRAGLEITRTEHVDGNPLNAQSCSCSCMESSEHDNYLRGTSADHALYDRHCPGNEVMPQEAATFVGNGLCRDAQDRRYPWIFGASTRLSASRCQSHCLTRVPFPVLRGYSRTEFADCLCVVDHNHVNIADFPEINDRFQRGSGPVRSSNGFSGYSCYKFNDVRPFVYKLTESGADSCPHRDLPVAAGSTEPGAITTETECRVATRQIGFDFRYAGFIERYPSGCVCTTTNDRGADFNRHCWFNTSTGLRSNSHVEVMCRAEIDVRREGNGLCPHDTTVTELECWAATPEIGYRWREGGARDWGTNSPTGCFCIEASEGHNDPDWRRCYWNTNSNGQANANSQPICLK